MFTVANEWRYFVKKISKLNVSLKNLIYFVKILIKDIKLFHFYVKTKDFSYIGCYKDDSTRDLSTQITNIGNSITIEMCIRACLVNGYLYAGLQNGLVATQIFYYYLSNDHDFKCNENCLKLSMLLWEFIWFIWKCLELWYAMLWKFK